VKGLRQDSLSNSNFKLLQLQTELLISNFEWSFFMTINELRGISSIKPLAPMSPAKAKIDTLKRTKDAATKNLKAERDRQKLVKAQQTIASINKSLN
jgi:hypothetical protein